MPTVDVEDMLPKIVIAITWEELEDIFDGSPWVGIVELATDRRGNKKDIVITVEARKHGGHP